MAPRNRCHTILAHRIAGILEGRDESFVHRVPYSDIAVTAPSCQIPAVWTPAHRCQRTRCGAFEGMLIEMAESPDSTPLPASHLGGASFQQLLDPTDVSLI